MRKKVSYLQDKRRRPGEFIDNRLSELSALDHAFVMGQYSGIMHSRVEERWWREGMIGLRPEMEKSNYKRLMRHYEQQFKKLARAGSL